MASRQTAREQVRQELAKFIEWFRVSHRSREAAVALSDTVVACYIAGHLGREEYRALMGELV